MSDPLCVIYNDTCPVCAREVAGYRRMAARHGLDMRFRGLSEGGLSEFGLAPRDAARRLHVVEDGTLRSGVPAFAAIWARLPHLRWLAGLVRLPVLAPVAALLYDRIAAPALFALHRRRVRLGKAVPRG